MNKSETSLFEYDLLPFKQVYYFGASVEFPNSLASLKLINDLKKPDEMQTQRYAVGVQAW